MKLKTGLILTAALITPGGLLILGAWKAIELLKEKKDDETNSISDSDNADHVDNLDDIRDSVLGERRGQHDNEDNEER